MLIVFLKYLWQQKFFFLVVAACFMSEWLLIPVFQKMIPDSWYLRAYLPWTAVLKTKRFLEGEMSIQMDPERGWRNGNQAFCESPVSDADKNRRLLILGDSRMNYSNVTIQETITSYLKDAQIHVVNLATEMYGLDQSILALKQGLERYQPDFVVVALGTDTGGHLDCHYLPFLYPTIGLPLLKPKFILKGDSLKLVPIDSFIEQRNLLFNSELMRFLKTDDPHYQRFDWFKRRRTTPFLGLISLAREWATKQGTEFSNEKSQTRISNQQLVKALVLYSKRLAAKYGVKLIYLLLPQKCDLVEYREGVYQQLTRFMSENTIQYVNVFELFKIHRKREKIYAPDGVHFTPAANRILALKLAEVIASQNAFVAR